MTHPVPVHRVSSPGRAAALALVPMAFGVAGALADEWTRLGFSTWRAACRAAGLTLSSLCTFTLQLLPMAVAGVLAGAGVVLVAGGLLRLQPEGRAMAVAAHGGCAFGMAAGLPLCLLALPLPLVLGVEAMTTMAAAFFLCGLQGAATRPVRTFFLNRETGI